MIFFSRYFVVLFLFFTRKQTMCTSERQNFAEKNSSNVSPLSHSYHCKIMVYLSKRTTMADFHWRSTPTNGASLELYDFTLCWHILCYISFVVCGILKSFEVHTHWNMFRLSLKETPREKQLCNPRFVYI